MLEKAVISSFLYCEFSKVCYRTLTFLDYPGYRVGDDGSLWSRQPRPGTRGSFREWRQIRPVRHSNGRAYATLRNGGVVKQVAVYRLVLLAFCGPCPEGMESRHFPDRDVSNNRLENLSWATKKVNQNDRFVHGTHMRGERAHFAKLTAADVIRMRKLRTERGLSINKLAVLFKVDKTNVWSILKRLTWKHLP